MKIVILDAHTLNPGDLSWKELETIGETLIFERTSPDLVAERCAGAEIILTNKVPVTREHINQLNKLRYIGVLATGYNIIDIEAAKSKGIVVTNVPGYSTASVVQHTFALLLELCQHVQRHTDSVTDGKWAASKDFSYHDFPLIELSGKTMGIIGFGTIGQGVADVASAFGMNVIAASRTKTDQSQRKNFRWVELDELFAGADVVSIHCPLTPETKGLINKANLLKMKPSAFLLNASRGPVVNEQDLADALDNGKIAGAALDVLAVEPPSGGNALFGAKNCLITPHIAWATREARTRLMKEVVSNIHAFIQNKPVNVVNR
jgi:glycerate dehydrogenase